MKPNAQEQMFELLDDIIFLEDDVSKHDLAVALSDAFGLTLPEARSVRDRWLKTRKKGRRNNGRTNQTE